MINEAAKGFFSGKIEHTKEALADVNQLLKDSLDPLADMLSFTEKINLGWKKTYTMQGEVAKQLMLTNKEISDATLKRNASYGDERAHWDQILKSADQQKKDLEHQLNMLRVLNTSGFMPIFIILRESWKLFREMDKATVEFNMHLGMMRSSTKSIQKDAYLMAINFMDVGVTAEKVLKSFESLGEISGGIHNASRELVKTTALLNAQLGISQETSAGFFRNMAAISGTSMESQKNMSGYAIALSNAAGTNLNQVMSDLASKSSNTLMLLSHIPSIAIKSAVEFRKLGTSLDAVADGAAHILNFTQSVQEEMEASVLLGHSLNMQKAREMAYAGNLVGYNREILNLATKNHFLNRMDMFQKQAFATMTGKSVADLTAMLQAEKELRDAKNSTNSEIRKAASDYEKLRSLNQAAAKEQGANMLLTLQQKSNQERLVAIQQKWNQLLAQAGTFLLPIIDGILSIVPAVLPIISLFSGLIYSVFLLGKSIDLIGTKLTSVYGMASKLGQFGYSTTHFGMRILAIFEKVGGFFVSIGTKIKPMLGVFTGMTKFSGLFGMVAKFLGPIGLIITAFQLLSSLVDNFKKQRAGGHGILYSIMMAGFNSIFDVFILPFKKAWDWLMNVSGLAARSPSKLGLSIVKGIVSVGAMIYDALTYPFRHGFAWIADNLLSWIPGMSKVSAGLRGGASGLVNKISSSTSSNDVATAAKEQSSNAKETKDTSNDSNIILQNLLDAINGLRKDLNDGKIAVNLDSSRVSTYLSRGIEFKGSFAQGR